MDKLLRDKRAICIFIAPAAILFTGILLIPIVYAIYISLCDWNALTPPQFEGFKNYIRLFTNDDLMKTA
ncbi:MAG: sugar ABC transporter permease, partial [Acetanaerobacterium sp.]